MQEAGGGFDWQHALSALGGTIVGAMTAIGTIIYRAGGREPTIRADFQAKLTAAEQRIEDKVDGMTEHFREYFDGIRRQQDDIRLAMERDFVRNEDFREFRQVVREDFREFREENRSDMAELKRNIAKILGEKS